MLALSLHLIQLWESYQVLVSRTSTVHDGVHAVVYLWFFRTCNKMPSSQEMVVAVKKHTRQQTNSTRLVVTIAKTATDSDTCPGRVAPSVRDASPQCVFSA